MKSARELTDRFEGIAGAKPTLSRAETGGVRAGEWNAIHWIKPSLLCEVAFTEWTQDGHIRHPSFQGLRKDKEAGDVKQETPEKTAAAAKLAPKKATDRLVLSGVSVTHPDRVISETGHVTKGELAQYHAAVAPFMLPRIAGHPLSLLRCPAGIDGKCFFQRNPGKGLGADVHPFEFRHKGKRYEYLYIEDEKGLLEVIQMGAIELHPWGAPSKPLTIPTD
jgi:bifunctional non-homologous end joining protein LigD